MSEFTIIKEKLAHRCEVCHQKDCFDEPNNRCSRCSDIKLATNNKISFETKTEKQEKKENKQQRLIPQVMWYSLFCFVGATVLNSFRLFSLANFLMETIFAAIPLSFIFISVGNLDCLFNKRMETMSSTEIIGDLCSELLFLAFSIFMLCTFLRLLY
jgi:hypothetical protein